LTQAVRHYLTIPSDRCAKSRLRQQRRLQTHLHPRRYLRAVRNQWKRWALRWQWEERCQAWDEYRVAEQRQADDRAAAEAAIAEAEENERQRQLYLEQARLARRVSEHLLAQVLQCIEAGELHEMSLSELLPHLHAIGELMETGQRIELGLDLERRLAQLESGGSSLLVRLPRGVPDLEA
jgi:multidrug efflux pump subunit AcrA (membrane-fusion protein)